MVCACEIDAFNYVDLAAVGPVWSEEPISAVVSIFFFRTSQEQFEILGDTRVEARICYAYQNAGQTPQIEPGICAISAIKRP